MSKRVCVTGASGYIAQHLCHQLIERGYTVVGTVRNKNDTAKVIYLNELAKKGNLEIVEADLMKEGSFDDAVKGCEIVFHTASPFFFVPPDQKEEAERKLINVAVEGTKNVLGSVSRVGKGTVKRVIITSSVAAVVNPLNPHAKTITDDDWNENSKMEDMMGAYRISKVKGEKAAWEWAKENPEIEVVAINPTYVVGPVLPPSTAKFPPRPQPLGTSCDSIRKFLAGEQKVASNIYFMWVDVRDVALMHILAAESPKAVGQRYIGGTHKKTLYEVVQILKELYPQFNLDVTQGPSGPEYDISGAKAENQLGFKYRSIETMLKDTVDSLIELGYVQDPKKE